MRESLNQLGEILSQWGITTILVVGSIAIIMIVLILAFLFMWFKTNVKFLTNKQLAKKIKENKENGWFNLNELIEERERRLNDLKLK
jgi:preprotein translocase subunit SecY